MANKCTVVTPSTYSELVQPWYEIAINTPAVSRFLSVQPYITIVPADVDTWSRAIIMDSTRRALAVISPDRGMQHGTLSCWTLPNEDGNKKHAAGSILKFVFNYARMSLNLKYLEWVVHATNVESMYFSNRNAEVWGRKDDAVWDSLLGTWVASYYFRRKL